MAEALYTPQLLALATSLANYPWVEGMPLQATARSKSCGSVIALGLAVSATGQITKIALKTQACAVGQAAAAIFASAAIGCDIAAILKAEQSLEAWLTNGSPQPDWPGLEPLLPARAYPARHAAIMLSWQAAREALSSGDKPR